MNDVLVISGVTRAFDGVHALTGVDVTISGDQITGIIGPNGSGKSTLFNAISGIAPADSGEIIFDGLPITRLRPDAIARAGIRRTFQVPRIARAMTVLENLLLAVDGQRGGSLFSLFNPMRSGRVRASAHAARARAIAMIEILGLDRVGDDAAGSLSGGQLKLLSLGCALLGDPRLLLLDEPMAGVNRVLVDRVAALLRARRDDDGLPTVVIEHNLGVVQAICDRVVVLDGGRVIADGRSSEIRADPQVRAAYLGKRAGAESG